MTENPLFKDFMASPAIQSIAKNKRWTVSTNQKIPIDMRMFIAKDTICGAAFNNDLSLVSLDELHQVLPNAANFAYYLSSAVDKIVVMDIEPKCPDDLKQKLKSLPALYAEMSMSGKGVHLLLPLPEKIAMKYPAIATKTAMKETHGWYEVLIEHYVTFTGKQIPFTPLDPNDPAAMEEFDKIFEELAKNVREYVRRETDIEEIDGIDTEIADKILELALNASEKRYRKTPEDFHNDMSRYEFSYLSWLYNNMQNLLNVRDIKQDHQYTDSEIAWLMYKTATEFLPYRDKHDEERNGLPWLLFEIKEVMSKTEKTNTKQKGSKKNEP